MKRRQFLQAGAAGVGAAQLGCGTKASLPDGPPGRSAVAILKAASYKANLADILRRGFALCGLDASKVSESCSSPTWLNLPGIPPLTRTWR